MELLTDRRLKVLPQLGPRTEEREPSPACWGSPMKRRLEGVSMGTETGSNAAAQALEIVGAEFSRVDRLAWAIAFAQRRPNDSDEEHYRRMNGWISWIRTLNLPRRDRLGAPTNVPTGVPVVGIDVRDYDYVRVPDVAMQALSAGMPWPATGIQSFGGVDGGVELGNVSEVTDGTRRLALLRKLGGNLKYSNGDWSIKGIAKLVAKEVEDERPRRSEKTIRSDLKEAAQAERDAKAAGFYDGLGQR